MGMKPRLIALAASLAVGASVPLRSGNVASSEPSRMAQLFIDALVGLGFVNEDMAETAVSDGLAVPDTSDPRVYAWKWDRAALATLDEHTLRDLYVNLKVMQHASPQPQGEPA